MLIKAFRIKSLALVAVLAGVGLLVILSCMIFLWNYPDSAAFQNREKELPIYYVDTKEKTIALTFDCAWGDSDIPRILETLKVEEVKASFFLVGKWAEKYPDTVRMIAQAGHDIGNHGYSHLKMSRLDGSKIESEISLCSQKLEEITGRKVDLFRPPYGDYSNGVIREALRLKHFPIQWNVDSLDWKPGIGEGEILNRIKNRVKPGSILLFHNDTPHTANLMPQIIQTLKSEGYSFLPLSSMVLKEQWTIDSDGRQRKE